MFPVVECFVEDWIAVNIGLISTCQQFKEGQTTGDILTLSHIEMKSLTLRETFLSELRWGCIAGECDHVRRMTLHYDTVRASNYHI